MSILSNIKDIFKPVLSDRTIMKYNKKGILIEGQLTPHQIQPNSVDLTLGNTYKILNYNSKDENRLYRRLPDVNLIDPKNKIIYEEGVFKNGEYVIEPGEFVLMASNEVLNIPNGILSFVQGRSSIARLGIQTEQAGLIDAGFKGTITFEVFNQTKYPIKLYEGMRIAQVYFFKAQKSLVPYGKLHKHSKYFTQSDATGSRIHMDPELKVIKNKEYDMK